MSMTQVRSPSLIPGTPSELGKYNASMDGASRKGEQWWVNDGAEGPQSLKVEIDAPLPVDRKGKTKELKKKRGCPLVTVAILLRLLGFVAGFAMCALGGWILYKIAVAKTASQMVQFAAFGVFLLLCGLLTVLVETRTKRTMRGCLNTYIIVSSYLARGIFYLAIGSLTFAVKSFPYPPPYVQILWIACGIVGVGAINLVFYPFYCQWERKDDIVKANPPKVGNAEEVIYDMAIYNPESKKATLAYIEKQKQAEESASRAASRVASPVSSPLSSPMMAPVSVIPRDQYAVAVTVA